MAKQDDYVRYTIRVPKPLYDAVQEAAGEKSINAEIVARLEESFATESTASQAASLSQEMFDWTQTKIREYQSIIDENDLRLERLHGVVERTHDAMQIQASASRDAVDVIARLSSRENEIDVREYTRKLENFLQQLGEFIEGQQESAELAAITDDLLQIVDFIQIDHGEDTKQETPKLQSDWGKRVSQAIDLRTERAGSVLIDRLIERGWLKLSDVSDSKDNNIREAAIAEAEKASGRIASNDNTGQDHQTKPPTKRLK